MLKSKKNKDGQEMSFLGHVEELRMRIIWALIPVVVFMVIGFVFLEFFVKNVLMSLKYKEFPTYRFFCMLSQYIGTDGSFCKDVPVALKTFKLTEDFSLAFYFAIVLGIVASIPFILYQVWAFIKPGLKAKEIEMVKGKGFWVLFLLVLGVSFGYFVISPLTISFFGNFRISSETEQLTSFTSYFKIIVSSIFACAIFFQLPVFSYVLSKLGIITPTFLRKYRKHSIVVILILAAIITPPDPFTQVIVAIPVLLLYEISIMISSRIWKKAQS